MAKKIPWYVYVVANHSLEEVYVGVKKDIGRGGVQAGALESVRLRWRQHCAGKTKAVDDWDCAEHLLEYFGCRRRADQARASALAHELERDLDYLGQVFPRLDEYLDEGYEVIQTAGV